MTPRNPPSPAHAEEVNGLVNEAVKALTMIQRGRRPELLSAEAIFLGQLVVDVLATRFSQEPTSITAFLENRVKELARAPRQPEPEPVEPEPEGPGEDAVEPSTDQVYGGKEGELGGPSASNREEEVSSDPAVDESSAASDGSSTPGDEPGESEAEASASDPNVGDAEPSPDSVEEDA